MDPRSARTHTAMRMMTTLLSVALHAQQLNHQIHITNQQLDVQLAGSNAQDGADCCSTQVATAYVPFETPTHLLHGVKVLANVSVACCTPAYEKTHTFDDPEGV